MQKKCKKDFRQKKSLKILQKFKCFKLRTEKASNLSPAFA